MLIILFIVLLTNVNKLFIPIVIQYLPIIETVPYHFQTRQWKSTSSMIRRTKPAIIDSLFVQRIPTCLLGFFLCFITILFLATAPTIVTIISIRRYFMKLFYLGPIYQQHLSNTFSAFFSLKTRPSSAHISPKTNISPHTEAQNANQHF